MRREPRLLLFGERLDRKCHCCDCGQRTDATLARVSVGTSGWSYPSWRPGFYPAGADPAGFLAFYAERFPTVELNTTGYRLPAEE